MSNAETLHATVAFDPADGRILRVHFTKAEPASTEAAWVLGIAQPGAKVLHCAPGSLETGRTYRVDLATETLVACAPGEAGVSAGSGFTKVG
ncbi:hypothetical protein [Granulicella arctica]|uniref:hypothetical protein n=1 Tax=Granulicella arctica TaxID=940613 RepID=UPI0021E05FED|nr:hypothetical protein [Granulicella arctica]